MGFMNSGLHNNISGAVTMVLASRGARQRDGRAEFRFLTCDPNDCRTPWPFPLPFALSLNLIDVLAQL